MSDSASGSGGTSCPECGEPENLLGVEVRGVYDGVLFWVCRVCDLSWARFTGTDRLSQLSHEHAERWRLGDR